ncbi:MAG: acyl-CoA dehydrogenase family protein [Betaproteobacteria bacterium]|nr:acyl-CoA dehydrogenase family protein [Betaproteobacteria bacterium]
MSLDFSFSEEHQKFRAHVREFARAEIAPYVKEWDEVEQLPTHGILPKMGAAGLIGITGPKSLGGGEKDYISLGIAIEELGRVDTSCAMICSVNNTMSTLIPGWGDDVVRSVFRGEKLLSIATSEDNSGSDVANLETTAAIEGDRFVINGKKIHVSLMPGADYMGVTAWVDWKDGKKPRITFIKVPSDTPGVSCEPMEEMGCRGHQLGIVHLKDVKVPVTDVLGGKGAGKEVLYARWGVSRCLSALNAIGAAQQVLDDTIAFVKKKIVYGRPIAMYQGVSFPLIEHYTKIEACRLMAYKGLWMSVAGENPKMQATMAKWSSVTAAVECIQACLQMFGAAGYLKDLPVERRLRDVMALLFTGGTINIMKIIVIQELLGKEFAALREGGGEG